MKIDLHTPKATYAEEIDLVKSYLVERANSTDNKTVDQQVFNNYSTRLENPEVKAPFEKMHNELSGMMANKNKIVTKHLGEMYLASMKRVSEISLDTGWLTPVQAERIFNSKEFQGDLKVVASNLNKGERDIIGEMAARENKELKRVIEVKNNELRTLAMNMQELQGKHNSVVQTVKNMVTNLGHKGWTKNAIDELKKEPKDC